MIKSLIGWVILLPIVGVFAFLGYLVAGSHGFWAGAAVGHVSTLLTAVVVDAGLN
jgi:hypothetical protein